MTKRTRRLMIVMCILLLLAAVAGFAALKLSHPVEKMPTVSSGTLIKHNDFASKYVEPRDLWVWLPAGYRSGDKCDVLYMHDGQMLFDASTTWNGQEWQVDEVMSKMLNDSTLRPCIVVGIDNTGERLKEYFPDKARHFLAANVQAKVDTAGMLGDRYLRFIVEEVKPFIDERYKPLTTREHTYIMGSSMGGLISLYALCEYPDVFGGAACLSSHLSFDMVGSGANALQWADAFRKYVDAKLPEANTRLVYMDRGTEDFDAGYAPHQQMMDSVFRSKGWDDEHFQTRVFNGHQHRETAWAKRLNVPAKMLLARP